MKKPFEILYQDADIVVMDKPWGFHVHNPENQSVWIPRHKICLPLLRAQLGQHVYPVHRLDVATTGLLVWALNSEAASKLGQQFQSYSVQKRYEAIVRGWTPEQFAIDTPLEKENSGETMHARTRCERLATVEFNAAVGKRFKTARYSWLSVTPETGRFHQIRRHLNRVSHPIVGDTDHGDSHHNRFFKERLEQRGLCLRAMDLEFKHPRTEEPVKFSARQNRKWLRLKMIFEQPSAFLKADAPPTCDLMAD
jgi:tRNA pseudouridine65 synthase